jgi:RNA polymerase sigma-70 factor (ECF subfamily)
MEDTSLAALFLAQLDPALASRARRTPGLEAALQSVWRAGHEAWPTVTLDQGRFVAFVAARFSGPELTAEALSRVRSADLYLACACESGDPAALACFERHYFPEVDRALAAMKSQADLIAEAKQNLRQRLFVAQPGEPPKIAQYGGRGDLHGWVRVAAVREVRCIMRKGKHETPADDNLLANLPAAGEDPELAHLKHLYRGEFKEAFLEALRSLESRERNILRYSYLDGLSIDGLGAIYGVHRATAARWLASIRESLLARTRDNMTRKLQVSQGEFESIMRLIESHLEVSLHRFLVRDEESETGGERGKR